MGGIISGGGVHESTSIFAEVDRSDSEVDIEVDGAMPDAEEQKRYTGTSIQVFAVSSQSLFRWLFKSHTAR